MCFRIGDGSRREGSWVFGEKLEKFCFREYRHNVRSKSRLGVDEERAVVSIGFYIGLPYDNATSNLPL